MLIAGKNVFEYKKDEKVQKKTSCFYKLNFQKYLLEIMTI